MKHIEQAPTKDQLDEIKARAAGIGYDWPSTDVKRDGPPERVVFPNGLPSLSEVCWDRQLLLNEVARLQEYEWMYKDLCK